MADTSAENEARPDRNWLIEEFEAAKARTALLPVWARPVVTRPLDVRATVAVERIAVATWSGHCSLDPRHPIRPGDRIGHSEAGLALHRLHGRCPVSAQRDRLWWETHPAALEAMYRVSARERDWEGCEAALLLMAPLDPHRADILFQAMRVAGASGTFVFPTPGEHVLAIEAHMLARKAEAGAR